MPRLSPQRAGASRSRITRAVLRRVAKKTRPLRHLDGDGLHRPVGDPPSLCIELAANLVALSLGFGNVLPLGRELGRKAVLHLDLDMCVQRLDLLLVFEQSLLQRRFEGEPEVQLAALGDDLELMDPLALNERIPLRPAARRRAREGRSLDA